MALLRVFIPPGSPYLPLTRIIGLNNKFVELSAVQPVESGIYLRVNLFGASYETDALKNDCLKNDRPLSVSFPTSYAVKLHSECQEKPFTNPYRQHSIALGGQKNTPPPYCLPPTILVDSSIQLCSKILVHTILIDTKECISGGCVVNSCEVSLTC